MGDEDADNIRNQLEYAYGLDPTVRDDPSNDLTTSSSPGAAGAVNAFASFRRDSNAKDLTYTLQSSPDLFIWTTLATVTSGNVPVTQNGASLVADSIISGSLRLSTIRQTLAAGSNSRRFMRLQVSRAP